MTRWPRVTEILEAVGLAPDFSAVAPEILAAAQQRGTAVHKAIEALAYGYLDEAAVDPEIAPYLDAYRTFVAESGHEAIASEVEVIHPTWRYAGHPDRVGWLLSKRVILDWKTGESVDLAATGYQLAGYRAAWNAEHPTEPVEALGVVQLKRDGTYRFHEISATEAEPVFLAAVMVFWAKKRVGGVA